MTTTFADLPPEVLGQICRCLDLKDLFSLRLVDTHSSKPAVTQLSKRSDFASSLESVVVLYTRDGLTMLKGLCQVPEFRRHIKNIAFVTALSPENHPDNQQYGRLPLAFHVEPCRRLMEEHSSFLNGEELPSLLHEVLTLVKDEEQLSNILIGFVPRGMKPRTLPCGSQALSTQLSTLPCAHNYRRPYLDDGLPVLDCICAFRPLFEAFRCVNFNKKVFGVQVTVAEDSPQALPQDDWALLGGPCLKHLELRYIETSANTRLNPEKDDHFESTSSNPALSQTSIDTCLHAMRHAEVLHVSSNHKACALHDFIYKPLDPCTLCTTLFICLNHHSYPHLQRVDFRNHVTSSDHFLHFFLSHQHQLRSISLADSGMCKGSWKEVIRLFGNMPELADLKSEFLFEAGSRDTRTWVITRLGTGTNSARVEGKEEVGEFVAYVMRYWVTSQKHAVPGVGRSREGTWASVVFPKAWC